MGSELELGWPGEKKKRKTEVDCVIEHQLGYYLSLKYEQPTVKIGNALQRSGGNEEGAQQRGHELNPY